MRRIPAAPCLARVRAMVRLLVPALGLALVHAPPARAGGGPRNVLLVVNERSEESREIAARYAELRRIPASNICRLATSDALTVSKATYQDEIETPVRACIAASPHAARIDYIVLTRGLPIRALFPDASAPPTQPVSLGALLQAMDTTLQGKDQEFTGGFQLYTNPYRGRDEWFAHAKTFGGKNLYLVTMLSGYWSEDGIQLAERSVASDGAPPSSVAGAEIILENGSGAANVRDGDFPAAKANLEARGLTATHVTGAEPEVSGRVAASWVGAGTYSGNSRAQIESNTYPPGALVDILESFGLTPNNFTPGMADQVPVTWWVSAGITGAHGTVAEPYNVAFPDGFLLEPYVDGYNLAETFYQGIPHLYWMSLVLGDPLCQPYAVLPAARFLAPIPGQRLTGTTRLRVTSGSTRPEGIRGVEIFDGDALLHSAATSATFLDWDTTTVPDGHHRLEVLATDASRFAAQGSATVDVTVSNRGLACAITSPSGGAVVGDTFVATVTGSASLTGVELRASGVVLGAAAGGPPWAVTCDATLLGRGNHELQAIGLAGASEVVRSAPVVVRVVKPPRAASALAPDRGPTAGGTAVTLTGAQFEPEIEVLVAGSAATVTRIDSNHLALTTPPGPPGPQDVRIVNPAGQELLLPGAFTYEAPPCGDPTDADGDGWCDENDNCPADANPRQEDRDGDGVGDACDGCAVTSEIAGLLVAKSAAGWRLQWDASADACFAAYRVFRADAGGAPVAFPAWPAAFTDVTAEDLDGDALDAAYDGTLPPGALVVVLVAAEGSDGSLGP